MKQLSLLFLLTFVVFNFSCTDSDDSNENDPPLETDNVPPGFSIDGGFNPLNFLYLNYSDSGPTGSSISLIMVSQDLLDDCDAFDVNYVLLEFATNSADITLEPGTYETPNLNFFDYVVFDNGIFSPACELNDSDMILNDAINGLLASSISLTVSFINDNTINLSFTIIREDGEIINGTYSGAYTDVSDINTNNSNDNNLIGEWNLISIENQGNDVNVVDCQTQQTITYNANNTGSEFFPEEISQTPCEFGSIQFNWQLNGDQLSRSVNQEGNSISQILILSSNLLRTVVIERNGNIVPENQREIFTYTK